MNLRKTIKTRRESIWTAEFVVQTVTDLIVSLKIGEFFIEFPFRSLCGVFIQNFVGSLVAEHLLYLVVVVLAIHHNSTVTLIDRDDESILVFAEIV